MYVTLGRADAAMTLGISWSSTEIWDLRLGHGLGYTSAQLWQNGQLVPEVQNYSKKDCKTDFRNLSF